MKQYFIISSFSAISVFILFLIINIYLDLNRDVLQLKVHALDNGLALTPPMGWMSWLKYACNIDCVTYPNECINEHLYREMVDHLVSDGYLALGYSTVNIDDCWSEKLREEEQPHRLVGNRNRFPSGIAELVNYAHSKGVQLGIYEDVGTLTCGGYPGTRSTDPGPNKTQHIDHTIVDAETFSSWGVDSLKLDGCYADVKQYPQTYPEYTRALARVKHKIVYACSWPAYLINNLTDEDYAHIRSSCNYWRNYDDIEDSFVSVQSIIAYYRKHATTFIRYHGPGGWFDPDMLIIGNDGLSFEQAKTQMAFWSLWSAPLLMSNDLRSIGKEFREILQNRELIAIDQDPLGLMGQPVESVSKNNLEVWVKKLFLPSSNSSSESGKQWHPYVVLYYNKNIIGVPAIISHRLSDLIHDGLGPPQSVKYNIYDLYGDPTKVIATLPRDKNLTLRVKTSGSVRVVKLVPIF